MASGTGITPKLSTFDASMIVVSLVIGIGIFRTPAIVASHAGSATMFYVAWILGGAISLFGALTFAEIGSRFPRPGAFYQVVAESYHPAVAFMLNWTSVTIVNGAGGAVVASTIFVLRYRDITAGMKPYTVPLYPALPALFIAILFTVTVNVILSQPGSVVVGFAFVAAGFPLYLIMRRLSQRRAPL